MKFLCLLALNSAGKNLALAVVHIFCAYGARFGFENVVIRMAKMRCPDIKFLETDRACFAD